MRIRKDTLFIFVLLMMISLLSYGLCQESSESEKVKKEPLSKWSKQWLEEVVPYIISPKEKEVFKNLPNEEERGKFIENFWRTRDPDKATPENEFKMEYYRRIAFANKFLTASTISGWRTDRGRIFILLGPPNEIQQDFSQSGSFMSTFHGVTETWSYMGLPGRNLPYSMDIVFVDKFGTGNYVLKSNLGMLGGGGSLDLSAMHYHFDFIKNMAEIYKTPQESLKKLEGVITSQVTYDLIPLKYDLFYLKGTEKNVYSPIVIEIPYSKLPNKKIEDRYYYSLALLINISNKLGQITHKRSKNIDFDLTKAEIDSLNEKEFQVQTVLSLEPEDYKIHLLILDNFSGKIGTLHQEISIPDIRNDELILSDIILSHQKYKPDSKLKDKGKAGQKRIFPEVNRVFSPDQELNIFFEIYNLILSPDSGKNNFSIEYLFFHNQDLITQVPHTDVTSTDQSDCRIQISVKLKNFKPGIYTLQVKVIDRISGKSASKEVPLKVTE